MRGWEICIPPLLLVLAMMLVVPQIAAAEYIPPNISEEIADAARQIIIEIVSFLTPIVDVICVGMILMGLILAGGLRQEFYGMRLIIGGGIGLLVMHVIIPMILSIL